MDKSDRTDWLARAKAKALRSGSVGAPAFAHCVDRIAAARECRRVYQSGESINARVPKDDLHTAGARIQTITPVRR